ncbi:MAG: hypothetical protein U0903_06810 [Planctomycetales bacterium]
MTQTPSPKPAPPDRRGPQPGQLTLKQVEPWIYAASYLLFLWFWFGLTWGRWCDPLVDFGQQLYLAWQVSEGKHLYKDLAYYNGPLSVWINATVFELSGVNLWHLVAVNAAVMIAILGLVHLLIARTANQIAAFLCGTLFLWLFAFGNYLTVANYNYLTPYNHEMTHGLFFSFAMLAGLFCVRGKWWLSPVVSGLALGCVWLTKAELSLAATGAAVVWWFGTIIKTDPAKRTRAWKSAGVFCLAAVVPILIAFLWISRDLPPGEAFASTLGSWQVAFNPQIRNLPFYKTGMGLDQPLWNGTRVLLCAAGYGGVLLICLLLGWRVQRLPSTIPKNFLPVGLMLAITLIMVAFAPQIDFLLTWFFLPLPLVLLVLCGILVRDCAKEKEAQKRRLLLERIVLVTFAGLLLGKTLLATRVSQYGFVLTLPATIVVAAAYLAWIPERWGRFSIQSLSLIGGTATLLIVVAGSALHWQQRIYMQPTTNMGTAAEQILPTAQEAQVAAGVAEHLSKHVSANETVMVFPEGVMLNYLSRRRTSVPYTNYMPPEVLLFGEEKIDAALQKSPPDWIVIFPKNLGEYGMKLGRGYLDKTLAWMEQNYQGETRIQDPQGFTVMIMKRRAK